MEHGAGVGYTTAVSSVKMQNSQDKRTTGGVPGQNAQKRIEGSVLMRIVCNGGELQGMQWEVSGQNPLIVGRERNSDIHFTSAAKGVSGRHCSIQHTQFGWTVKDLGSSYGTFVSGNHKVLPGTEVKLHNGDVISLGGNENTLLVNIP